MGLFDWLRREAPIADALRPHIDRAVALAEPRIAAVAGHERRLAPVVAHALAYCDRLAEAIPGPIEISRAAFAADPVVHALFGSAEDIEQMLARSQCVREHLVGPTAPMAGQCCALLGMRRHEKSGFGPRLAGELISYDEPQTALYFTDHTLAEPSPDLAQLRQQLTGAMFDGLVRNFAAKRQEDRLPPERALDELVGCLDQPETCLRLTPVTVAVDRSGIIVRDGDETSADTLRFMELSGRDQRRWVVVTARIERAEARRASERAIEARRHIVI